MRKVKENVIMPILNCVITFAVPGSAPFFFAMYDKATNSILFMGKLIRH